MPLKTKTNAKLDEPNKKRLKTNDDAISGIANTNVTAIQAFENFLKKLPPVTKEWREANGVAVKDTPSGLSKHVRDTIFVFSHKTKDNGNLLLGAYMHRLNNRKKVPTYDEKCKLVMEFDVASGDIVNKWTDWEPNASIQRMRPGIFVYVTRCFLNGYTGKGGGSTKIRPLECLSNQDSNKLTQMATQYTHFLSNDDMWFPSESGWK